MCPQRPLTVREGTAKTLVVEPLENALFWTGVMWSVNDDKLVLFWPPARLPITTAPLAH